MRNKIKNTSFLVIFLMYTFTLFFGNRLCPPPTPPGGLRILGGGVPPGSLNLNPTSDQKIPFSLPFLDLASKIRPRT